MLFRSDYSGTAASNNSASPNGWPEGMAPSGVNNSDRELAARIARERDDVQGVTASGGSANAYTLAALRDTAAAYTGEMFIFRANHTNTGAATINITPAGGSARGTVAIQREGSALVGNEIISGGTYAVLYDGTQYQLLGQTLPIVATAAGELTIPTQPLVLAYASAVGTNVTGDGTAYTVVLGGELTDQNADFASNTFTAPVTGSYMVTAAVGCQGLTASETLGTLILVSSNRNWTIATDNPGASRSASNTFTMKGSALIDMDSGDTLSLRLTISNGALVVDHDAGTAPTVWMTVELAA